MRAIGGLNPYDTHPDLQVRPGKNSPEQEQGRLRVMAKEFEELLIGEMVKAMRKSVPESELLAREPGRDMFNEMLDGEYARLMAARGGIGIAEFMVDQLGNQSKSQPGNQPKEQLGSQQKNQDAKNQLNTEINPDSKTVSAKETQPTDVN